MEKSRMEYTKWCLNDITARGYGCLLFDIVPRRVDAIVQLGVVVRDRRLCVERE